MPFISAKFWKSVKIWQSYRQFSTLDLYGGIEVIPTLGNLKNATTTFNCVLSGSAEASVTW